MTDAPWTETERRAPARATLALVETCVRNTKLDEKTAQGIGDSIALRDGADPASIYGGRALDPG